MQVLLEGVKRCQEHLSNPSQQEGDLTSVRHLEECACFSFKKQAWMIFCLLLSFLCDLIVSTKCRAFFLCHLLKKPPTEQVNPMENGVHPKAVKVLTLVWHVGMTKTPRIS